MKKGSLPVDSEFVVAPTRGFEETHETPLLGKQTTVTAVPTAIEAAQRSQMTPEERARIQKDGYATSDSEDDSDEEDEDSAYDEYGRKYAVIKPIVFKHQFRPRHGDPGLTVMKFGERLIRGLIPRLATDGRLQFALAGTAIRGLIWEDLRHPSKPLHGVVAVASKVKAGVVRAAGAVAHQAVLVKEKVTAHGTDSNNANSISGTQGEIVVDVHNDNAHSAPRVVVNKSNVDANIRATPS